MENTLQQQGRAAREASRVLATAGTEKKNAALEAIASVLTDRQEEWLRANEQDLEAAESAGMRPALLDRLRLTPERIAGIVEGIRQIIALADEMEVPVAVAGGIYERADMEHYLEMGAKAVQIATRFVTTKECDASEAYKQAYINAKKEDIVLVKSPVGMPGRAIHNAFLDKVAAGERFMRGCRQCISTCNPETTPYCITEALVNAVKGNLDEGLIFCGSNAYRANKIETVADIMEEFS